MSELQDLVALIRANTPLIVIETPDEARAVSLFRQSLLHVWRALWHSYRCSSADWEITANLEGHGQLKNQMTPKLN